MKPIYKYILISLGASLVLGYICVSLWTFSQKGRNTICNDVEIRFVDNTNRQLLSANDVASLLEEKELYPIGKAYKKVRTESIEHALRENDMVEDAEAYKTPSGVVQIVIYQRQPKFRVCAGFENYYIDSNRKVMPLTPKFAPYIPVVSGRVSRSRAKGVIYDFVTFLEENPFWNAQIEQIYIRDDLRVELVPRVGDAVILLGTFDNFVAKLGKLQKLYAHGFSTMGWNRYQTIDLQYKDQVVCTKVGKEATLTKMVIENKTDSTNASKPL